jgi:hypothetical protein
MLSFQGLGADLSTEQCQANCNNIADQGDYTSCMSACQTGDQSLCISQCNGTISDPTNYQICQSGCGNISQIEILPNTPGPVVANAAATPNAPATAAAGSISSFFTNNPTWLYIGGAIVLGLAGWFGYKEYQKRA